MAAKEPQRKLQRGENEEQGEHTHWEQAVKNEVLRIEKKGRPWSELGEAEAEKKEQREPED